VSDAAPPVPATAFALDLEVVAADIDELEHVSNVRVVDWMNRAAVAHSNAVGFDIARYREVGGVFVVRRHEIEYLASAYLGDKLRAFTWPTSLERATAERRHEIRRLADGRVIARGSNLWVFVSFETGRPMRIPAAVVEAFDPRRFSVEPPTSDGKL
jgi:acyl-CoA thioester hydrolase